MSADNQLLEELQPKKGLGDDFLFHAADYIYRRRKQFITLGVIFALIVVGVYLGLRYKTQQDLTRAEALYAVEKTYKELSKFPQEQLDSVLPRLNDFIAQYPESTESNIARFYRSNIYLKNHRPEEAEGDLRHLSATLDPQGGFYPLSVIYLSNALRDRGEAEEAAKMLEDALYKLDSDVLMIELGETYFSMGKKNEAKQALQDLLAKFPESLYKQRAERLLDSL